MRALVVAGAAALLLAGCTSSGHHSAPRPGPPVSPVPLTDDMGVQRLHGMPLPGQLDVGIVDGDKLINLDTHRTQKIAGLPSHPLWVDGFRVSGTDVLATPNGLFALRGNSARRIADTVRTVVPGLHGIWLTRGDKRCTLTEVSATGRTIVPARPINCGYQIIAETQRGLIAQTSTDQALLDKQLRPTVRGGSIAVAGQTLITSDGKRIKVGRRTAKLPATIGALGGLYVSPDNAYVAVEFDNPACPGPRQCLDTRILQLTTMQWIHPPSMPVSMYLKPHNLYWGPGDRFSWLGTFDGIGAAMATWQPGATVLRMRQISLPNSQYGVLHS